MSSASADPLDRYLANIQHLPASAPLLPELLRLLSEPNSDGTNIVRLITFEPALTASLLRWCNTVAVGSATPVVTVDEAVVRVGFETLYRLVAAVCIAPMLRRSHVGTKGHPNQLWEHSVTTAMAAQLIARHSSDDPNLVFTAALLHDVGKILLSEALGPTYLKLLEEVEANQYSLIEAEKRVLGVDHAELGGRLLARWSFPINLVSAVWFHPHPKAAGPHQRLAAYLYLGNLIAYLVGYGFGQPAMPIRGRSEALEILGLDGDILPGYMMETYGQFTAIRTLLNVTS